MKPKYSNDTLRRCDQTFEKHFRKFAGKKLNRKGTSELKCGNNDWIQFYFVNNDRSSEGASVSSFINSLKIKIWYRLNKNATRGEICVRNIHDGTSAPMSSGKSSQVALEVLAKIYPMDILFCHLQVHLETLYYKFAPYHKNAVVNVRNGYRDQANYKKEVYLSKKPPTISIPKTKASPCHNYNINNQYSNGFQSKVNIPSTYSNKSVLYMPNEGRVAWVLLVEQESKDIDQPLLNRNPARKLTSIKILLNESRNISEAVPIHKPNYTILGYLRNSPRLGRSNSPELLHFEIGSRVTDVDYHENKEEVGNTSQNKHFSIPKNLPKHLTVTTVHNENIVGIDNMNYENKEIVGSTGSFSPALSDLSTSSVNIRQRKLSETVVDWVFDDSDCVNSMNSSNNDISEDLSSKIKDEKVIEDANIKDYSENRQIREKLDINQKKPKARRSRIAANIYGKIDNK